jgi:hypothetical protein
MPAVSRWTGMSLATLCVAFAMAFAGGSAVAHAATPAAAPNPLAMLLADVDAIANGVIANVTAYINEVVP